MGFVESVKTCFRKWIAFSGRASRSEFWWFALFLIVFLLTAEATKEYMPLILRAIVYECFKFFLLIALWAAINRRLHDIGKSGWWFGLLILAVIMYVLFIVTALASAGVMVLDNAEVDRNLETISENINNSPIASFISLYKIELALLYIGYLVFLCAKKGTIGTNKYGADPLTTRA